MQAPLFEQTILQVEWRVNTLSMLINNTTMTKELLKEQTLRNNLWKKELWGISELNFLFLGYFSKVLPGN